MCAHIHKGTSRILLGFEPYDGTQREHSRKWTSEYGTTVGVTMRLTEKWHHTDRVVVGDRWFGGVLVLYVPWFYAGLRGLFATVTNRLGVPVEEVKLPEDAPRGTFKSVVSTVLPPSDKPNSPPIQMICQSWKDNATLHYLSIVGNTAVSNEAADRFQKWDSDITGHTGSTRGGIIKVVCSMLTRLYQMTFGCVDNFNQSRLQGASPEKHIATKKWPFRCYLGLWNIGLTCARKGKELGTGNKVDQLSFHRNLSTLILDEGMRMLNRVPVPATPTHSTPAPTNNADDTLHFDELDQHRIELVPDLRTADQKKAKVGGQKNPNHQRRKAKQCHVCWNLHDDDREVTS